ncbi:MAG: aldehyde dehydrogenase family protein [Gemmatimonadaceae bacterium]|nr:aldehyde dehydrogenase family protein [Gemmatimonadaceae bacterium]NUQ91281.1 aldehyde dehydrogenase family protein [Gemmatimonadaceae bacterium]NUR21069.1 aldehyde dehydrogenase family protein [Gemmatimonadaceae bacterium]NUS96804.1 aldehyde dehydrogenase family protein [Gemmatimonadaceae bacterium]
MKQVSPQAQWDTLLAAARAATPEAFDAEGRPLNLIGGTWRSPGRPRLVTSPVDGRALGELPMLDLAEAHEAVEAAAVEARGWGQVHLDERKRRVAASLDALRANRDLLAKLLIWEIGKPLKQAETDVDRCVDGVEWYVNEIDGMMDGRRPLGVVSNIASWNYPYSVLVHSVLVQALAGNAVIAKTPTDGGLFSLTVGFALLRRAGLPVTLVSGGGGELGPALVRGERVNCLAFVGGRSSGRAVAAALLDSHKRHILEMEGVNAYGVWGFTDWKAFAAQLKKGYDYGKQRCTAYARFVVERRLFPKFLETYLDVAKSIRVGNPVAVDKPDDPLPALDFGPLINRDQVDTLKLGIAEAINAGAVPLFEGTLDPDRFIPHQDTSAYIAPAALLGVPRNGALYHREPFGPVDTITLVDSVEELVAEMNVSNGSLVGSLATDDAQLARELSGEIRSFKIGVNSVRSRGDREEVFGGIGQSWRGCFVGGRYLVQAVTEGAPGERLYGNFADYTLLPAQR